MAKDKVQIIQVNTDPAKTSIKELRKQLKDLKDEMANLEEGGDEFLEVANKAGELKHQLDEINESVKGASADFGDMVGNITNVTAGLVGAFEAVAGGLQAMGVESEAIDETIVRMQGLMAMVQGLSAIDDGIKAMDKLATSITGTSKAAKLLKSALQPKVFLVISAAIAGIVLVWNQWGDKIKEALPFVQKISDLLGGNKEKIEEARKEQEKFNEELAISDKKVAEILEKRKWDAITPEAQAKIKEYQDNLVILENQLLNIVNKQKSTTDRTIWEKLNEDGKEVLNQIKEIKGEIDDLYTNPKYQKSNQVTTPTEPTTPVTRDGKVESLSKVAPLVIEPIVAELTDEDKERIQQVIAEAMELAKQKRLEELQGMQDMGDAFFNNLKSSISAFSESTLGITSGWTAALDDFQQAFTYTMNTIKDTGKMTWENYAQVSALALGGVATMLNALSNEQDASNEEGFRKMKALQIAATTINVLSGVTAAISGLFTTKSGPWDIALAAIQAATIAATGALQISKIKNTTMTSANPNYNVNAKSVGSMIVPPVQYSQAVQGAQINGNIGNQKVYVTESDITGTIKAVVTQEEENTY